jgi:DNA repair protein RadD
MQDNSWHPDTVLNGNSGLDHANVETSDASVIHPAREFSPLREYQRRAIERARGEFINAARAVLLVAPTGSGKSVIFAEIARQHLARGGRVVVVVHRRELARQAAGHLAARGIANIRTIVGGRSLGDVNAPVTVAAIQSLTAKAWRDRLPPATLVIWDECHHIKAPSFMTVRDAYSSALHIGLTATPQRADRSPLGDVFDSMVVIATVRELTDAGFLVPCEVWGPNGARNKLSADAVDAYLDHGENKRAIVFCANVVHAKECAERLRDAGVASEYVDGTMPTRDRDAALARFASGQTQVITNCNLISEGFDVPACKCIVIARGCDSVAMYLQAVGRALRPEPSGETALVIDLRGATHKHGMPDADRQFSLSGEAISTGPGVEPVKQCKRCGAVYKPVPHCPRCGAASPMPVAPEVRAEQIQRITEAHTEDQRREYWQRLQAEAQARGYKHGWAYHRYRARYGVPPRAA